MKSEIIVDVLVRCFPLRVELVVHTHIHVPMNSAGKATSMHMRAV